jgi:L-seryl-tRNA(Ser) seleniumtransferase
MLLCGVRIVEVVTVEDYKRAFTTKTVMTNFYNAAEGGEIDRHVWLDIAHQHDIPMPHGCRRRPATYRKPLGVYRHGLRSRLLFGGKGIRGPQNAGLLLGRKCFTDLAAANNNPNSDAVGRGMKVAKEQIVGMVAALEWFLEQKDQADQAEYMRRVDTIMRVVKNIPTMMVDIFTPEFANRVPDAILSYDRLRAMRPRIELNSTSGSTIPFGPHSNENTLVVATWMMQPADAEIVGRHLRDVLSHPTLTQGN